MPSQELDPRSPNVAKYDDDMRRRLAKSFRTAKKTVSKKLDAALLVRQRNPQPPSSHSPEGRVLTRQWPSARKVVRSTLKDNHVFKFNKSNENAGSDRQLYRVVSEGQWSGDENFDGVGATFLAPDALNSFGSESVSFDLSVHD